MKRLPFPTFLSLVMFAPAVFMAPRARSAPDAPDPHKETQSTQAEGSSQKAKEAMKAKESISWGSPRVRLLEREWTLLDFRYRYRRSEEGTDASDAIDRIRSARRKLLKENFHLEDMRALATSADALPIERDDRTEFTNELLSHVVLGLLASGDRARLVTLLSTRFPNRIGPYLDTETGLVLLGTKLKDPILVLEEAYTKSKVPEVRRDIATAVRHGFMALGVHGKGDADVVKNAMDWYRRNKDRIDVNRRYAHNASDINGFYEYRTNPLFTLREAKKKKETKKVTGKAPGQIEKGISESAGQSRQGVADERAVRERASAPSQP
jgi:hypothetical protein